MEYKARLLLGTKKGLFLLEKSASDAAWQLRGPFCDTWPISHAIGDPTTGTIYAGGGNEWFGPAVWASADGGESWTHSSSGLGYGEGEDPVKTVWSLACAHGKLYAGVQPAGLFESSDGGKSWIHLSGLQDHPTRSDWMAGGAGLILHHILPHPKDASQIWVGISAVGVFHTADGGASWTPRNQGVRNDYAPEEYKYAEYGQCVHSIAFAAGNPDRIYQQNHCGMYRSDDGGQEWESVENGLPSSFGFPAAAHPTDPECFYLFPLNGDQAGRYAPDARAAVWRTRDGGASWQDLRAGLPQQDAYLTVLRQAMATDPGAPEAVYFGTTSGSVFASADGGENWERIAQDLPFIASVETMPSHG